MSSILIDVAAIGAAGLIGWTAAAGQAKAKIGRLTDRLEIAAQRSAQLIKRNRELSQANDGLQEKHDRYRASRSAAVAKGNRTRSARFHAQRAAGADEKAQQLTEGR